MTKATTGKQAKEAPTPTQEQAASNETTTRQEGRGQPVPEQSNTKKAENGVLQRIRRNSPLMALLLIIVLGALIGGVMYWQYTAGQIYIENAAIDAPIISLGPKALGIIDRFYVSQGDQVRKNQVIAKVGDEYIRAKTDGLILEIQNTPGQMSSPQDAVVQMIDPREFRLVGRIEEDKGLADIRIGQRVVFTVDAFGPKQYDGVVDSISPTSRQSDIVFSISDKRQEKEFEVKATFDVTAHPELRNGMSAKMWVYK